MQRRLRYAVLSALTLACAASFTSAAHGVTAQPPGRLVVVQAVPGQSLDVAIDGRSVDQGSAVGSVLGPYPVAPGEHHVSFSDSSGAIKLVSTVSVTSGASSDVVVHRPAQVDGAPVVNQYRTPQTPIGPGKARVLIAHTATVAPADVRVDGTVVFTDIANGEYATADVPAGHHVVSLLPTGITAHPILGPLSVDLEPGTVTMVYAVGDPKTHSMNVILHSSALASNGAAAPATIETGSAGLVARVHVQPFAASATSATTGRHLPTLLSWGALLLVLGGSGLTLERRSRKRADSAHTG